MKDRRGLPVNFYLTVFNEILTYPHLSISYKSLYIFPHVLKSDINRVSRYPPTKRHIHLNWWSASTSNSKQLQFALHKRAFVSASQNTL